MAWTFIGSVIFLFFSFWEDYYWLGGLFLLRESVSASWRGLNDCRSAEDLLTKQIILIYLSYFESLICSLTDKLDLFFNDYWCLQVFFLFDEELMFSFVHWLTDRLLSLLAEINLLSLFSKHRLAAFLFILFLWFTDWLNDLSAVIFPDWQSWLVHLCLADKTVHFILFIYYYFADWLGVASHCHPRALWLFGFGQKRLDIRRRKNKK